MKSLRRILVFVKPYLKEMILATLLIIGVVLTDLAPPRLTQHIIDVGVANRDLGVIARTSILMVAISILGAAFAVVNTIFSVRVAQGFAADLRNALVHKVQTFSFGNLDEMQTGDLLVRTTSDVNQVQMMVLLSMRMFLRAPLWLVGSVFMMIVTVPELSWLMLALLPLLLALIALFAAKARPMFMQVQKKLDRLNEVLQENLAGVRVVKAFVRVSYENERFDAANEDLMAQFLRVAEFMAILIPSVFMVINLATVSAVWFGGKDVIAGRLTVGQLMASFNYLVRALFPLMMIAGMIGPLSAADASAERILKVLDDEPDVKDSMATQSLAQAEASPHGARIAFENVTFSYDGHNQEPVLQNLSLVAEPGQEVAILGATGSGKSSLVHLIPRFYDVSEGRITLDGVDIREMPLHTLRRQMGISLQEAVLFGDTVRENIRYGRPDASDEQVVAAAEAAQAHAFIVATPDGYDTLVGQRGVNFSGGQKQRLAIARALLVNPRVLILDDSTSAVDVETEIEIQAALDELKQGRTSFIIAQRISTVLNADKIVVLERGRIVAEGTHDELMVSSPIYREIHDSQLGDGGSNNG